MKKEEYKEKERKFDGVWNAGREGCPKVCLGDIFGICLPISC